MEIVGKWLLSGFLINKHRIVFSEKYCVDEHAESIANLLRTLNKDSLEKKFAREKFQWNKR